MKITNITDPTEHDLDAIKKSFEDASNYDYTTWTTHQIVDAATRVINSANRQSIKPLSIDEAKKVAEKFGRWIPAARTAKRRESELECWSGLAQIFAHAQFANRDTARRRSSALFNEIYEEYQTLGDTSRAAIALTNSALALLELHNPTSQELDTALNYCQRTIKMRVKGSADFAYSAANLAIARRKKINELSFEDRGKEFKSVLRLLASSASTFKNNEISNDYIEPRIHHIAMECVNEYAQWEIQRIDAKKSEEAVASQTLEESILQLNGIDIVSILRSNPRCLGFQNTPAWVPTEDEVIRSARANIKDALELITKAKLFRSKNPNTYKPLDFAIFQAESTICLKTEPLEVPWGALEQIWHEKDIERYLLAARGILKWERSSAIIEDNRFHQLLLRVHEALNFIRSNWKEFQIQDFVRRNEYTFRFAACHLACQKDWRSAFELLEDSRALISSASLIRKEVPRFNDTTDSLWVHVTHSPIGTFCISFDGSRYAGKGFLEITGSLLSTLFTNLQPDRPGPLSLQGYDRVHASQFTENISLALAPIGDWIAAEAKSRVALIPGGYYQSFPIWACGTLAERFLAGEQIVFLAPSRRVSLRHSVRGTNLQSQTETRLKIIEAHSVPGSVKLDRAVDEARVIPSLFSNSNQVIVESATETTFLESLNCEEITHYTGHSNAAISPIDSSISTYGAPLAVRDILNSSCSPKLVVFSSCSSGLARNFELQDEMLTLQTAAYYAGASHSIGTIWKVYDTPSLFFSIKFYEHLAHQSLVTSHSIYDSFRRAIAWMSRATFDDVSEINRAFGLELEIPNGQDRFFSFYDWSAYSIVGIIY